VPWVESSRTRRPRDPTDRLRCRVARGEQERSPEAALAPARGRVRVTAGHSTPGPRSPVRTRSASSTVETKILPSPRGPYCVLAVEAVKLLRARGFKAVRLENGVLDWRDVDHEHDGLAICRRRCARRQRRPSRIHFIGTRRELSPRNHGEGGEAIGRSSVATWRNYESRSTAPCRAPDHARWRRAPGRAATERRHAASAPNAPASHPGRSPESRLREQQVDCKDDGVRRLLAIVVAGVVVTTSATVASEPCPTMRAHALKRCCCPPAPQGHARLTCCTVTTADRSTNVAREHHEQSRLPAAPAALPWSFVGCEPSLLGPAPMRALYASAAGPPPLTLRI
jgi:hypothetical protein